jgi:predicted dehydrogenase
VKILIAGLGSMGRRRLRNLQYLGGHELAGLELNGDRRESVGGEFHIPTFADVEQGLAWGPTAMIISTPPDRHLDLARVAAEHSVHFFTEASVVPEDTTELEELADEHAIVAAPSCTMRFHPAVQRLKELLEGGSVGKPLIVTHHMGQYLPDWHPWEDYRSFYVARRETGAAREMIPFELNWLTYLFGRVVDVCGVREKRSQLETDIDDIYSTILRFDTGVRGALTVEVLSRPGVRLARVVAERGTLIWDWNRRCVKEWVTEEEGWKTHPDPPPIQGPGGDWVSENMYISEMEAFVGAVAGSAPFPATLRDDRHLLTTLVAIEQSSDTGGLIDVAGVTIT